MRKCRLLLFIFIQFMVVPAFAQNPADHALPLLLGRWLREGKFEFDHARTFPHLDVAFAEQKHAAHMAGTRDERLFLWSYWLLGQWMKG